MTVAPDVPAPPAALSAFLRGAERRALVLARLQCNNTALAEQALAAALRAFGTQALAHAMADWPTRFWRLLAATPPLQHRQRPRAWPAPLSALGQLQEQDRLALLLRIVAGLDEQAASQVLELTVERYQQALARACPRDASGQPDPVAWRALAEAAQQQVCRLSPAHLTRLAQLRQEALTSLPPTTDRPITVLPAPAIAPDRIRRQQTVPNRCHVRTGLGIAGVVLLIVMAAWWWTHRPPALPLEPVSQAPAGVLHVTDAAPVLVEALPAVAVSAPPMQALEASDVTMLADPDLELARRADFYAWYAAGHPAPPEASDPHAATTAEPSSPAPLEMIDDAE